MRAKSIPLVIEASRAIRIEAFTLHHKLHDLNLAFAVIMFTLKDKSIAAAIALRSIINLRVFKAKNDVPILVISGDAIIEAVLNC